MRINANVMAINTHRQLFGAQNAGAKSMEKLSSGLRINRAADDAAGLAISEKMRSQVRGMKQASRNAQDAISVVQTAEGAMDEVHSMLQRMRELAVQSANDSNQSTVDREAIQAEVNHLISEIGAIASRTQFNKMTLLDGTFTNKTFHVGANKDQSIKFTIESFKASDLGINALSVSTQTKAEDAISTLQGVIETVATRRANLGAIQNRIEHTIKNLDNSHENLTAAESRVRHVDMALEVIENTKNNILQQASTAMLSQANQSTQNVLQLLR